MSTGAKSLYDSIKTIKDVEKMITDGESESLFLECKSPDIPRVTKDVASNLSEWLSGFSNSGGGVIIFGVSTVKKAAHDLDVLTEIEEIANCSIFASSLRNKIPILTTPSIIDFEVKTIKRNQKDAKGLVVAYIPQTKGDPVQSNGDNKFYIRSGDECVVAPYQIIKSLFSSTESPDIEVQIHEANAKVDDNGIWEIPIVLDNKSSAVAQFINISIKINNFSDCSEISSDQFNDTSSINQNKKIFMKEIEAVLHKGLPTLVGKLKIKMKPSKKKVTFRVSVFANKMSARYQEFSIKLYRKKFTLKEGKKIDIF